MSDSSDGLTVGVDGRVDHHGEELPQLTHRSANLDVERLLRMHHPDFSGEHPATPGIYTLFRTILSIGVRQQFRSYQITGLEQVRSEAGAMFLGWHTNGLLDATVVVEPSPKRFVFAGRHDMLTGSVVGWWGRRLGVQPLLRQAERLRGGVDEETAAAINSASMLTVAAKLAHGHATALFPEGHSHNKSHLIRLRTGPMRSILNATVLAHHLELPLPVIHPVGIHFRHHERFRTDTWVEYSDALDVPLLDDSKRAVRLLDGEWAEPDVATTRILRDEVGVKLAPLTPDAPDETTWRAWLILGHLRARAQGKNLESWRDEVLAARAIRDGLRSTSEDKESGPWAGPMAEEREGDDPATTSIVVQKAKLLHGLLDEHDLDGRDLHSNTRMSPVQMTRFALSLLLCIPLLPFALLANGFQWAVGWWLVSRTPDPPDKWQTYIFVPGLLGQVFVWPLAFVLFTYGALQGLAQIDTLLTNSPLNLLISAVAAVLVISVSTKLILSVRDSICDVRRLLRLQRMRNSESWSEVETLVADIGPMLDEGH